MAGTTLRGIGEGEEEDEESEKTSPSEEDQHALSGPTIVDNAKVAEGLKRLRALDEPHKVPSPALLPKTPPPMVLPKTSGPSFPLPGSKSTLLGVPRPGPLPKPVAPPAVGTGTLFGIGAPEMGNASVPASGPVVSHTLAGVVAPVDNDEATIPVNAVSGVIEHDVKGTMVGHDRHAATDARPPEGARVITEKGLNSVEFSGGERRFFESEPVNTEFEPEFRPSPYPRISAALAVAGVFIACVWGYVRYRRSDTGTTEAQTAPAETPAGPTTATAPPAPPAPPAPAAVETPPPAPPPVAAMPPPAPPAPVAPTPEATPAAVPSPAPSEAPAPPPPSPAIVETPPAPAKPNAGLAKLEAKVKESTRVPPPAKPRERAAPMATDRPKVVARERQQPGEPLPVPTRRTVRPVTTLDGSPPVATPRPAPVPGRGSLPVAAGLRPASKPSVPILPATLPPSNKPIKAGKHPREDDPDGTLPLSID